MLGSHCKGLVDQLRTTGSTPAVTNVSTAVDADCTKDAIGVMSHAP